SFFFAFQSVGRDDNPKAKNEKILHNVGLLLEKGHVHPRKFDDEFSKDVLKHFMDELDDDKAIFLLSDLDSFHKYKTTIDDEIRGAKLESFYGISEVYSRRL